MPVDPEHTNFAAIDVGSHTIRLLIASIRNGGEVVPLHSLRSVTRLARGFGDGERLAESTMKAGVDVLQEYSRRLDDWCVGPIEAGATGVVRRARNGGAFLGSIFRKSGIPVRILSEEEEARLSAKGVLTALSRETLSNPVVVFDLGGSSTELLLIDPMGPAPDWNTSVFIGAATLTERFLKGDPTERASAAEAREAAREALRPSLEILRRRLSDSGGPSPRAFTLVGTAGTVATLAAMNAGMEKYSRSRLNGLQISAAWTEETIEALVRTPIASRSAFAGLERGREDIILGGALIVAEILKGLDKTLLTVSGAGLLEGLMAYRIEKEYNRIRDWGAPPAFTWRPGERLFDF
jgi:exopolyphosphatase/guanosine-5'-triphosphate,3'-diphosphate pyrophosphatase